MCASLLIVPHCTGSSPVAREPTHSGCHLFVNPFVIFVANLQVTLLYVLYEPGWGEASQVTFNVLEILLVGSSSLILRVWISMPCICFSLSSCLCKQLSLAFSDFTWSLDPLLSKWTCICFLWCNLVEGKSGCFSMWILLVIDEQRLLFQNQGLFGVKLGIEIAINVIRPWAF